MTGLKQNRGYEAFNNMQTELMKALDDKEMALFKLEKALKQIDEMHNQIAVLTAELAAERHYRLGSDGPGRYLGY